MTTRPGESRERVGLIFLLAIGLACAGCGNNPAASPRAHVKESGELIYSQASQLGLTRTDTVDVSAAAPVLTAPRRARVVFTVRLPGRRTGDTISTAFSGTCVSRDFATGKALHLYIAGNQATVPVTVTVPRGADSCTVTLDALYPGRPYTGDGQTVSVQL